jgi:hypothetical protein
MARPAVRCSARSKRTGEQCRSYASHHQRVCRMHGASSPQAKAKAEQRKALAQWQRTFGEQIPTQDPTGVMLSEIAWTRGHVEWLRLKIEDEGLRWEKMYGEWSDRHLSRQLFLAHRAGIEERATAVVEEVGSVFVDVLRKTLAAIPDLQTRAVVRAAFTEQLAAVMPGPRALTGASA